MALKWLPGLPGKSAAVLVKTHKSIKAVTTFVKIVTNCKWKVLTKVLHKVRAGKREKAMFDCHFKL